MSEDTDYHWLLSEPGLVDSASGGFALDSHRHNLSVIAARTAPAYHNNASPSIANDLSSNILTPYNTSLEGLLTNTCPATGFNVINTVQNLPSIPDLTVTCSQLGEISLDDPTHTSPSRFASSCRLHFDPQRLYPDTFYVDTIPSHCPTTLHGLSFETPSSSALCFVDDGQHAPEILGNVDYSEGFEAAAPPNQLENLGLDSLISPWCDLTFDEGQSINVGWLPDHLLNPSMLYPVGESSSASPQSSQSSTRERRFPCPHKPCDKVFGSNNDLERHLGTRKHRKDVGNWSERANRYPCKVTVCKRNNVGFARKDHYINHLRRMHQGLELDEDDLYG
ncbi:uncharacterized protein CC84DRAFT_1249331 [Paraphaeosphaeria sporulosa]|uniref:C2H2-type domain-containing protein n=1 Tax=Paraphaeosphaeria sporulosa TaxID=1460663 RepID=A0A177C8M5_9PLEO|nr:uncharacterized protein CC84DRAFT_1249331 [Paraphaeosphaeria sporulosa]OAG03905.1 hypothetical protein CC84DRAFT_1249331 [Paraphaeosphaeria sporulosa]